MPASDLGTRLFGKPGGGQAIPGVYQPAQAGRPEQRLSPSGLSSYTQQVGATQEYFNPQAAQQQGAPTHTPTGEQIPTANYAAWSKFIKDIYGMEPADFLQAGAGGQYDAFAEQQGLATTPGEIPTGPSGMPDRPPGSPQEAALFQWQAGEVARQENQQLLDRAVAAYQYALGTLRQGGPGSLYQATQPIHGQLAQTLSGSEYTEPDFSFWLTRQA